MRILSRRPEITDPNASIPASRRAPSWPRPDADVDEHPFWQPAGDGLPTGLPPEDRHLLTAYPDAPPDTGPRRFLAAMALASAARRSGCRILAASRAFEFEAAVGQNLAILADQDHI
jgi:hypothetical protein